MITEILNEEQELDCDITVVVRSEPWALESEFGGIQVDNTITPLFCGACNTQLKSFYKLQGSRYGQVGSVRCHCGAEIYCSDSDSMVEYLETVTKVGDQLRGNYYIDFRKMYKIDSNQFSFLKDRIGFDIFDLYSKQRIDLKHIIEDIEIKYKIEENVSHSFAVFGRLPKTINKWYSLLDSLKQ
jgi:hypothetical protein